MTDKKRMKKPLVTLTISITNPKNGNVVTASWDPRQVKPSKGCEKFMTAADALFGEPDHIRTADRNGRKIKKGQFLAKGQSG